MDMQQVVNELESAAEILLAPPNIITSEQRHNAESVFLNFQKSDISFQLCQYILSNSKSDYVLFQAASILKQTVIRQWRCISKNQLKELQSSLLNFVFYNANIQSYVREQLLLVVAVMVKKNHADGDHEATEHILSAVSGLFSSGNMFMQVIGCSVLTALLIEFSSTVRSSDIGLTWEAHMLAKKEFEKRNLKKIFQYCLQGLSELNKINLPLSSETIKLFKKFIVMAEQVLTWDFQPIMFLLYRKFVSITGSRALRPTEEWREVFLDPNVMHLFFTLHWQVRDIPDLCHHTIQCLNQLSSLSGIVLREEDNKLRYASWFMENFLKLLTNGPIKEHEAIGLSNIVSYFHMFFPESCLLKLPIELRQNYLIELTKLTSSFCENAVKEEFLQQDDQYYMEAYKSMLEVWARLFQHHQRFLQNIIKQTSIQLFTQYLMAHLSLPDGFKERNRGGEEEIDEIEEDDRAKFQNQLIAVGLFGREITQHSIPLLIRLFEERIARFYDQLQRAHQLSMSVNTELEKLNEDIHWLILISGHVLSCVSEGEITLIPQEIIKYCESQNSTIDMDATLNFLTSPNCWFTENCDKDKIDPVVRLITAVFQLCEIETKALEANLSYLLSPEVALSLVWFLQRWAGVYLFPKESDYLEMSLTLTQAFGRGSKTAIWTLNFLLGKLEVNFRHWTSETKLIIESAQALVSILNKIERDSNEVNCPSLSNLIQKQSNGHYSTLPTAAKCLLLKAFVIVGTANKEESVQERYFNALLQPLTDRFNSVVNQENFSHLFSSKEIRKDVCDAAECFIGVINGCNILNLPHLLPYVSSFLEQIVKLIDIYHNCNDIVSVLFNVFVAAIQQMLCYLSKTDTKKLYEFCLNMIQIYSKHNAGKLNYEAGAEEEQHEDLLILMQLLTDLLSKGFLDIDFDSDESNSNEPSLCTAEVVLYGLYTIMPLINTEVLKNPTICHSYFKLITFVCELYPAKLSVIPDDLLKMLMSSIELGLTSYTPEITYLCLDFLFYLCNYLYKSESQDKKIWEYLQPFFKVVMNMLLFEPITADLFEALCRAFFMLTFCFEAKYCELIQILIDKQSDAAVAKRLADSFANLLNEVKLSKESAKNKQRKHDLYRTHRQILQTTMAEIRSFLYVK